MGRTHALRKCGEYEDCQLQSLNGGEWQHTPAKRSVATRLNLNEQEQERLGAQLRSQLATANTLTNTLQERVALVDALWADLDPSIRERLEAELADEVSQAEAVRVRAACAGTRMIVLDERGKPWTTKDFAASLARWSEEGCDVSFVIGSADGLDAALKREAAAMVSLSSCTLPHGLVRVMMAEQLYRATSLNAGHPYHRE